MRTQQTQSSGNLVSSGSDNETVHQSVLLQEVTDWLDIQKGDIVFDGTLGGAGHSFALGSLLGEQGVLIAVDIDSTAIARAEKKLSTLKSRVILSHTNFKDIKKVLNENEINGVNKVLLDLGWSSDQIERGNKGMSFLKDEPLSMRLSDIDTDSSIDAKTIVNEWSEKSLQDIIFGWGGERYAKRIAKGICDARKQKEIKTTFDLVDIIRSCVPVVYRNGRIHPATRTFQALRIAVNDELSVLTDALETIFDVLLPGGRIAIISFHSLEDRIVKRTFKKWKEEGFGTMLTKKPITASQEEIKNNPRARSAKMRIFEKYE